MRIGDVLSSFAEIYYRPLGIKGEDAIAYNLSKPDIHAQAVFDGCGGSGAWKYPEFKNASGAFVAAQSISNLFLQWFDKQTVKSTLLPDKLAESFHVAANDCLQRLKAGCAPMGVAGSLVKSFPCTASIAISTLDATGNILLTSLNAGDSRVYFLTPALGLVQMTKDDSRGNPDALQSLRDSAVLSNLLNADKPFRISARQVQLNLPCAVICATDGVFGFLRSPMDFEYLLLHSLMEHTSIASFESAFEKKICKVTGDDSACLVAFYGWNSYESIKESLRPRYLYIQQLINQIDAIGDNHSDMMQIIEQQWNEYKKQTVWDEMQE